jgi:transcriptional regulator with XRE-family HTH domain
MANWQELPETQIMEMLAIRIKEFRIRKKLTQKELAYKSGVSLNSIQNLEQGQMVSLRVLLPVLRVLRLTNNLSLLVPETPLSPIALLQQQKNTPKRVKNSIHEPNGNGS